MRISKRQMVEDLNGVMGTIRRWVRAIEKPTRVEVSGLETKMVDVDPAPGDTSMDDVQGVDIDQMGAELRLCAVKLEALTEQ